MNKSHLVWYIVLTMSTYLNAFSCCPVIGCLNICINKQLNRWSVSIWGCPAATDLIDLFLKQVWIVIWEVICRSNQTVSFSYCCYSKCCPTRYKGYFLIHRGDRSLCWIFSLSLKFAHYILFKNLQPFLFLQIGHIWEYHDNITALYEHVFHFH